MPKATHYTVVVIGTGFGGTMTALPIAREMVRRNKGESILMLERGTWWTTPVGTVQDKEVATFDFLLKNEQPVQYWSTPNNFRGFIVLAVEKAEQAAAPQNCQIVKAVFILLSAEATREDIE